MPANIGLPNVEVATLRDLEDEFHPLYYNKLQI